MKVTALESLHCDAGWRNFSFLKLTTDNGLVGWSEYQEGFGSPGVGAAIEGLAHLVVDQDPRHTEKIFWDLYAATRPAAGGVVAEALGAIENALLDVKAKHYGVPAFELLGARCASGSGFTGPITEWVQALSATLRQRACLC